MVEKKTLTTNNIVKIDVDLNEISAVQDVISKVIEDFGQSDYFKKSALNACAKSTLSLSNNKGNFEFISLDASAFLPSSMQLTEEEFFKIVGATKKGISKRSGRYQENLYGHYLQAKKENDFGYLSDVFSKAVIFKNNVSYVQTLMKKEAFMKEWRKNFGHQSPLSFLKNTGSLKQVNIVNERII